MSCKRKLPLTVDRTEQEFVLANGRRFWFRTVHLTGSLRTDHVAHDLTHEQMLALAPHQRPRPRERQGKQEREQVPARAANSMMDSARALYAPPTKRAPWRRRVPVPPERTADPALPSGRAVAGSLPQRSRFGGRPLVIPVLDGARRRCGPAATGKPHPDRAGQAVPPHRRAG